jgi:hypothetical protein
MDVNCTMLVWTHHISGAEKDVKTNEMLKIDKVMLHSRCLVLLHCTSESTGGPLSITYIFAFRPTLTTASSRFLANMDSYSSCDAVCEQLSGSLEIKPPVLARSRRSAGGSDLDPVLISSMIFIMNSLEL